MTFSLHLLLFPLLLFFLSLAGEESSPRLLITLGPNCNFSAEEFAVKHKAIVVNGKKDEEIKNKIKALDRSSSNHLLVLKKNLSNFQSFSFQIGYATLHLNCKLRKASIILKEKLKTIPTTTNDLTYVDPLHSGLFYDLLKKVDQVFKKHGILYWGTCGTLLGAVRHQGMIPWDDDIDIAIFNQDVPLLLSLKEILEELGLEICFHSKLGFYKIFFSDGEPIVYDDGTLCPWKFPFIDIFPVTEVNGKITYAGYWKQWQKQDFFLLDNFPLIEMPFGPLLIPIPQNPLEYIKRMYGEDWNDVAYVTYSHRFEKCLQKIKVKLLDREPAQYILP